MMNEKPEAKLANEVRSRLKRVHSTLAPTLGNSEKH
jgi:hypothetical protein